MPCEARYEDGNRTLSCDVSRAVTDGEATSTSGRRLLLEAGRKFSRTRKCIKTWQRLEKVHWIGTIGQARTEFLHHAKSSLAINHGIGNCDDENTIVTIETDISVFVPTANI